MMCQEVHCCSWGDFKHIDSRYALKLCASGFPPKSAGGVLLPKSAVKFERYLMGEILSVGTNVGQVEAGKKRAAFFHQRDATTFSSIDHKGCRSHLDSSVTSWELFVSASELYLSCKQSISSEERKKILLDIADALEANEKLIRTENESDIATAQQAGIEKSLISRLTLKPGKIASLAVRSGNGLLLKGGKEAMGSNAILHKVICGAIPSTVGDKLIGLVTSRDEIPDLLKNKDRVL
uniref:Uncharacterized protein n=1 Tax=Ananas comosus var. bracteatus TaxID=296719 RepID=A0A6V7NU09_ANACO|nr:unnamed protein product [Ananas comosus var. bracteatus]